MIGVCPEMDVVRGEQRHLGHSYTIHPLSNTQTNTHTPHTHAPPTYLHHRTGLGVVHEALPAHLLLAASRHIQAEERG